MKHNMLHMKLNSAVSVFAVAAAFSVLLPPSPALAGICFLPDCGDDILAGGGDINMNLNEDTEYCEKKGYTYYSSGKCPQYYAEIGKCSRDDYYLKCDAVTWCKQNGYNTETCSLPSFVDGQCPNGKPYYKGCKEDRPRACREAGYVNSCSPGRLYVSSGRCPWDSSYGTCCTASPSAGCPTDYAVTCDPSRGSSGTDTCGYTCYRCCSDECSKGSKNYTGSYATTTECGSTCRYCKDCSRGSRSYSGSYAETSECGTCYYCDDSCKTGQKSVSCSSSENRVRVYTTECGTSCYDCEYNTDCSATDKTCSYGCAYTNSCGKCTSCRSNPDCSVSSRSCSNGCASYNSCNKCTSCNPEPEPEPSVQTVACTVGMVYNSDHTCTDGKATGKTPIGIVGYANSSGTSGLIFSIAKSSKCMKMCSTSVAGYKESCTLAKLSCLPSIGCTQSDEPDENGCNTHFDLEYNGKSNTQCMVNAGAVWEVANYCHNFSTAGTSAGEWYLPSIGEARRVFGENYSIVSAALDNVNGGYLNLQWTSTQTSASCAAGADFKMVSFDNPRNICTLNFSLGKSSCSYQRCVREF